MEYLIVCGTALIASGLTLFSGFGLGTLLLPAFLLFFPAEVAVAMTAVVHFLNNLFKLAMLGRLADRAVVLRFGVPAVLAALAGAWLLVAASDVEPLLIYRAFGETRTVLPVSLLMGVLIILFAILEMRPTLGERFTLRRHLALGGALSGFFGGLSGHQGALRSAFLLRAGLSKEGFIATGVVISCLVDLTRISIYAGDLAGSAGDAPWGLIAAATGSAFLGAYLGRRGMKVVTMEGIRWLVAMLLVAVGVGVGAGFL